VNKILIATANPGKQQEYQSYLEQFEYQLVTLDDFKIKHEPEETGADYVANARIKAEFYGKRTALTAVADDTGLEVKALPGKLGVTTKRYAQATKKKGYQRLLEELDGVPEHERTAEFITVIALYQPELGVKELFKGSCRGRIASQARGEKGFGYDPVFIPEGEEKTFAELSLEKKLVYSSRGNALKKLVKYLGAHEL
jgi:XTP/dITP diphosphohydrolase